MDCIPQSVLGNLREVFDQLSPNIQVALHMRRLYMVQCFTRSPSGIVENDEPFGRANFTTATAGHDRKMRRAALTFFVCYTHR